MCEIVAFKLSSHIESHEENPFVQHLSVVVMQSAQSQIWIGASHTVGLKNVYPDIFNPDAGINATGLLFERKTSKKFGVGFGFNHLRYNYNMTDIYYSFSRCPFFLKYYGRFLNIKPTLYLDIYRGTNNTAYYYPDFGDLDIFNFGFGVSFSKDVQLNKRLVLEPELTYLSTNLEYFYPELTFGVNLKYKLR